MTHGSLVRPPDASAFSNPSRAGCPLRHAGGPRTGRVACGATAMQLPLMCPLPLLSRKARHPQVICKSAVAMPPRPEVPNSKATSSANTSLGLSQDFKQNFTLGEMIGKGGFGSVYMACGLQDGVAYAAKVLPKWRNGSCQLGKIKQEVNIWTSVQEGSCSVARLHRAYEDEENVYLVQELCQGGSLLDIMKSKKQFTEAECAQVCHAILEVVATCHERQICYGDVKPANVMLVEPVDHCKRANVKLIDFGCSQMCSQDRLLSQFTGTPRYMAPEIYLRCYGVESDMWGVGTIMYEMLCGSHPLYQSNADGSDPTKYQWAKWLLSKPLSFQEGEWEHVSFEAIQLIKRMLDRNLSTRITAEEALQHPWFAHATNPLSKAKPAPVPASETTAQTQSAMRSTTARANVWAAAPAFA